ncbi:MAG: hypothetical protein ABR924_21905 [Terracidiphilus sp.]|jgi:hypothetical protein
MSALIETNQQNVSKRRNNLKNVFKVVATVLFTCAIVALLLPGAVSAVASPTPAYPTSVDGMPVVLVKDAANTVGMPQGDVVLCVYDSTSQTIEDSNAKISSSNYLINNPLPSGWSIEVFGGPGATVAQFIKTNNDYNAACKAYGPIQLAMPTQSNTPSNIRSNSLPLHEPSFATVVNNDPSSQTITYQAGYWASPFIAINQNVDSAFENNLETNANSSYNGNPWLLQSGQGFYSWAGFNIYSDQHYKFLGQSFGVPYITGDQMEFEIYLSPYTGSWEETCLDVTRQVYDYNIASYAAGTQAIAQSGTGISFENWNTVSNWYQWFTNPINSYSADEGTYYSRYSWSSQGYLIQDDYGNTVPNNGQITGSLVGYGQASWWIPNMLIGR